HARLVHERAVALDEEVLDPLDAADDRRVIRREADGVQREGGVEHRGLDAAPLPVRVLVAEDPLDRARDGAAPEWLPPALPDELERPVDGEEEVPPAGELGRASERPVLGAWHAAPQLADVR